MKDPIDLHRCRPTPPWSRTCHGRVGVLLVSGLAMSSCYEPRSTPSPRETSCQGCHGQGAEAAPPPGVWLEGSSMDTTQRGVGAHQSHLTAGEITEAVPCQTCHVVPETTDAPGHMDTALPAEVTFSDGALLAEVRATWDGARCQVYCHGRTMRGGSNTAPEWTRVDQGQTACGTCHGRPPPDLNAAHQRLGWHEIHVLGALIKCSACHQCVINNEETFVDKQRHINGTADVCGCQWDETDRSCSPSGCHDKKSW